MTIFSNYKNRMHVNSSSADLAYFESKDYQSLTSLNIAKCDVTFWGQRIIRVGRSEGTTPNALKPVSLRSTIEKTLSCGMERFANNTLDWEIRKHGEMNLARLKVCKAETDKILKTKNWFTRLLAWIRDFSPFMTVSNNSIGPISSPFRLFKKTDPAIHENGELKRNNEVVDNVKYAIAQTHYTYHFKHLFDNINPIYGDKVEHRARIDKLNS